MFGKRFETAEATVLFIDYHSGGYHGAGDIRNSAGGYATYEVILEVRPRDGEVFRTDIKQYFSLKPQVGDVVKVKCDPKRRKAKIITKGDPRYDLRLFVQAADVANKAKHDAILAAPDRADLKEKERAASARLELAEYQKLRDELLFSGSFGTATVLRLWELGAADPPLSRYVLKVEVKPLGDGAPFTCSLRTFLNPDTNTIFAGSTVSVRFDPQDTARIILQETE